MALKIQVPPKDGPDESAAISLAERGRDEQGNPIVSERRLWVQLLAFTGSVPEQELVRTLRDASLEGVLYADINDPNGYALLTFAQDPAHFIDVVRPFVRDSEFGTLRHRSELAMLGRTYTIGYESDLDEALIARPRRTMLNPAWPWAVWYPLRRSGSFEQLPPDEQRRMLMEHGGIGRAFGRDDHAHDVRLSCHGLGTDDNDFVVGLVAPSLIGPSAIVQRMRRTQHTALYLERLGPFFVGRAIQQSPV